MSLPALLEVAKELLSSSLVEGVEFLGTKVRARLVEGYILDVYYNATLKKYSYTIAKGNRRVFGWDNAPHHKHVETYPHHFHELSGKISPSQNMKGDPTVDIKAVLRETKKKLNL